MKVSAFLLVVLIGLVPIAVFASLIIVPANVKWQPPLIWQAMFGTLGGDAKNGITAVATDKTGIYVVGFLGQPKYGLSNPAPSYAFLKKFDFNGQEIWSQQLGNLSSITVDTVNVGSDGLYLSGEHWANQTVFVEKHDLNGNRVWTRYLDNITTLSPWGISVSASGLYIAGHAMGTGPTIPEPVIMRSYDVNGNVGWTKDVTNEALFGSILVFTNQSDVYLAGSDQAPSTPNIVDTHAFIARYDQAGTLVWNRKFDSSPSSWCACVPHGLSGDTSGIYVGGVTFDNYTRDGFSSFLRKYDWNGTLVWTNSEQSSGIGKISAHESGVNLLEGRGQLARYDGNGNRVWSVSYQQEVTDLAVGDNGVYTGGSMFSGENTNALLVGYDQSASLVLGGVNPPYSFLIVGTIVVVIAFGIFLVRRSSIKRASLATKVAMNRYDPKKRIDTVVKVVLNVKV